MGVEEFVASYSAMLFPFGDKKLSCREEREVVTRAAGVGVGVATRDAAGRKAVRELSRGSERAPTGKKAERELGSGRRAGSRQEEGGAGFGSGRRGAPVGREEGAGDLGQERSCGRWRCGRLVGSLCFRARGCRIVILELLLGGVLE